MSSGSGKSTGYKNVLNKTGHTRTGTGGLRTTHVSLKQDKSRSSRNIGVAALPTPMLQTRRYSSADSNVKLVPSGSTGAVWGNTDKNEDGDDDDDDNDIINNTQQSTKPSPWTRDVNYNDNDRHNERDREREQIPDESRSGNRYTDRDRDPREDPRDRG